MTGRSTLAALLAVALASTASTSLAAQTTAKAFKVDFTGLVILPSGRAPEPDSPGEFRDKEAIFRAPLGFVSVGKLDSPATFELFGKPVTIPDNELLGTARRARGGNLADFPADPVVLCAEPQENFAKQLAAASTLMLSTIFSRFHTWTQTCLADTDRDGTMDHAFMIGTKLAADRRLFPITPVRYSIRQNLPIADSYMALAFADPALFAGATVEAEVWLSGRRVMTDRLLLGPKSQKVKSSYGIKSAQLPLTIDVAGAKIAIDSIAPDRKSVKARYLADAALMEFDYDQTVTTTVIVY